MIEVESERRIAAPAQRVFELFTDHARYAEFLPMRRSELERPGDEDPNGNGAVRLLKMSALAPTVREVVTAHEPPRLFVYELISGAPIRDHRGTVEIEPADQDSCVARYRIQARPAIPMSGPIVKAILGRALAVILGGVAEEAERGA